MSFSTTGSVAGQSLNANFNLNTIGNIYTTNGLVGIGTIAPAYTLDVAGTTRVTNVTSNSASTLVVLGPGSSSLLPETSTSGSMLGVFGPSGAGIISNIDLSTFEPQVGSSYLPSVRLSMKDLGSANTSFNVLTKVSAAASMVSRMFIDGSGNIGINTTVPSYTLDVNGSLRNSMINNTQYTPVSTFVNNSTVGGTAVGSFLTPNMPTNAINTSCYFGKSLSVGNSTSIAYNYVGSNNTANSVILSHYGLGGGIFLLNNTNVGINTSNPAYTLDVVGDIRTQSGVFSYNGFYDSFGIFTASTSYGTRIQARNAADTSNKILALNPAGGNVGINTASPGYTLDVGGTIARSGVKLPRFDNGTFSAAAPAVIPILFSDTQYNYVEIKIKYTVSSSGCNIVFSGNSANAGNGTALAIGENGETSVKYNLQSTPVYTNSGYISQSNEAISIDNICTIRIVRTTGGGQNRNHYTFENVYTWSNVGSTRVNGFGYISGNPLGSVILTLSAGTMSGTYSTEHSY